jgi:hypothetical protein
MKGQSLYLIVLVVVFVILIFYFISIFEKAKIMFLS